MGRSGRDDAYVGELLSNAMQHQLREEQRLARRLRKERNNVRRDLEHLDRKARRKVANLKVNTKLMYYIFTIQYS